MSDEARRRQENGNEEIYRAYWTAFWTCVEESTSVRTFNVKRATPERYWIPVVNTGIGKVRFTAVASKRDRRIDADFTIEKKEIACELFADLKGRRHDIESAFGQELKWEPSEESRNNKHRIYLSKRDVSVDERDDWRPQHEWLIEKLEKLHRAIMHTGVLEDRRERNRNLLR